MKEKEQKDNTNTSGWTSQRDDQKSAKMGMASKFEEQHKKVHCSQATTGRWQRMIMTTFSGISQACFLATKE